MRRLSVVLVFLACCVTFAFGGPNQNGVVLFHYNADATGSDGNYSGYGGLGSCGDVVVEAPLSGAPLPGAWFAYAAFLLSSSPRLAAATFGLDDYDANAVLIDTYGKSSDVELPTTSPPWPAPLSGIALAWNVPRMTTLTEMYWFTGYGYGTPSLLGLAPHPTQGGTFTDDSIPGITDRIIGYGALGFGTQGYSPCHYYPGACCLPDGTCRILAPDECNALSGIFQGEHVPCDPNPCPPPLGACCFPDGHCVPLTESDCGAQTCTSWMGSGVTCDPNPCPGVPLAGACCHPDGSCAVVGCAELCDGEFQGPTTDCDPNPCVPTAVRETSWGSVKRMYR